MIIYRYFARDYIYLFGGYHLVTEHSYWKWSIEIVDLPIKDGDSPVRYVNVYQRVPEFLVPIFTPHNRKAFESGQVAQHWTRPHPPRPLVANV